jgi:archaemetzincin
MTPGNIMLISFGYFEKNLPEKIVNDVEREFSMSVKTSDGRLDISEFYNPNRNQYDGNLLLKAIGNRFSEHSFKTIGIFNVDLYIPILTYIFGQAYLNGKCGIVSVYRLRNERYGLTSNETLFLDRVRKEVIHELGHMFGLIHCLNPDCVMRSSTYVEDIDQKSHMLCSKCRAQLEIL